MNPVIVRNMEIGSGVPKICAPVTGVTKKEILAEAEKIKKLSVDIAEWRADWFEEADNLKTVEETIRKLREALGETPLLFTFRTLQEGGKKAIDRETYIQLNRAAIKTNCVDLIDVEIFFGEDEVKEIIDCAHSSGVKVIASNHDFEKTPEKEEMIRRLCKMQDAGADLLKIAVMPQCGRDVLNLLAATEEMRQTYANRPIITISMSGMGAISRLCGEIFGSAVTFGAAGRASAPGQIGTEELSKVLHMLHEGM